MVWHNGNKSIDGLVRHVAYSKAWAHIDAMWLKFAIEPHYLQLGLAIDGVNPFGAQCSSLVSWLVMFNLPPWLVTKKFFVTLALIIPCKELYENVSHGCVLGTINRRARSVVEEGCSI